MALQQWIAKQHQAWMTLEPSKQFLAWSAFGVIACGLLMAAFMIGIASQNTLPVPWVMTAVGLGVCLMIGTFVSAILFLSVRWPHQYKRSNKKTDSPEKSVFDCA